MFRKILIWFGGMLIFSFAAYTFTSVWLTPRGLRSEVMRASLDFQLSEAARAYEIGGREELAALMARMNSKFPGARYLVDPNGRDLVTGEDRSPLLRRAGQRPRFRIPPPERFVLRRATPDGRYVLLIEAAVPAASEFWANTLVYGWIVLVIVLLSYAMAWTLAKPIRRLRIGVVRFGRGDLGFRIGSKRKDEIGDLERAFDQMADRIQTLLAAERRLLQDVSHELRSPLARLSFALELARSSEDPRAALDRVRKEANRLSTLVGELLQVTRAENDPESLNRASLNFREFLEELVADSRIEAEAHGCSIELRVAGETQVAADRELLHRAVENVLRNAIRHAPPGSAIEVALSRRDGQAVVGVRDYGPGVPEEQITRIFQPFYRVEEDRSRSNGGTGLGLAIAERAVRAHHGNIVARNMNPGLLVEIVLPADGGKADHGGTESTEAHGAIEPNHR